MTARHTFIADDFGMSPEVNTAIVECHAASSLHGASLMVDQAFTTDAIDLAREIPDLPVGLHLNFSDKRDQRPESSWQAFPWKPGFLPTHRAAADPIHASRFVEETRRQFEAYLRTELPLAFVNGHHHLHIQPVVFAEIQRCLADLFPHFEGWIRLGRSRFLNAPAWPLASISRTLTGPDPPWTGPATTHVWGSIPVFRMSAPAIVRTVTAQRDGWHEFYFHPGVRKPRGTSPDLGDDDQDRFPDRHALLTPALRSLAKIR